MQNETFSKRLRKALELNNMTQSELASKSGLDKSLISHYLAGRYNAKQDKITILSNVLNVSETWLMGFDVELKSDNISKITPQEFTKEVNLLLLRTGNLSEEKKKYIMTTLDMMCNERNE